MRTQNKNNENTCNGIRENEMKNNDNKNGKINENEIESGIVKTPSDLVHGWC